VVTAAAIVIAEIGATSTGRCPLDAAISPGPKWWSVVKSVQ
jgi:hypothetical protein